MIRLALIGAGRIGQVHALAVHNVPNASITAVVDTYPESAKALAAKLGAKVMELDEVFASNEIDAYIIASSTDTHSPLLKLCASVGKPVFCEKPIDLDYARAEECSDTASVTMNTASGAIAVITNSRRASYGYDQRVEAFGEKGMLQVNNTLENNLVISDTNGVSAAKPEHFFLERYADAYRIELTHFVESLQNGTNHYRTALSHRRMKRMVLQRCV